MDDTDTPVVTQGWRKRHPVVSRIVLYAFVVAALAAVAWVWVVGRNERLRAEFVTLDVLAAQDPDGKGVLRVLDDDFSVLFLPRDLERDVLRLRAYALVKGGRPATAEDRLREALALTDDLFVRGAIQVDMLHVRTWAGDPEGALKAFDAVDQPDGHATLDLAAAMARALALSQADRAEEGMGVLESALEAAPRPLPALEPLWVAGSPYSPGEAARLATKSLDEQRPEGAPAAIWARLMALVPGDFDAALDATWALLRHGNRVEAVEFWKIAARLDASRAQKLAENDAELRRLQDFLNTAPDR